MNQRKRIHAGFMLGLLVAAFIVVYYYWTSETLDEVRRVPVFIMVTSFVYVLLQIGKRMLLKENNWWDWLYYIGLLAVILPTFFATEENAGWMFALTDFGSLFLIIPPIFDVKILLKKAE